jgi:coniferyl-aldehyde dehydrogenase
MLKPSELAPTTARLIESMLAEIYPPEYVTVVQGDSGVAAGFAGLPFDHLLFTGSTRVGKLVMRAASENLTPVTLELGGKSPVIVHASFSMREAATKIMMGKMYNAGQTCVAPDYALVPRASLDEFIREARAAVTRHYPTLVANRDYTRILDARHYQKLTGLVNDAREKGAEVLELNPANETWGPSYRVFAPTLLLKVRDDMLVMQEEIFGPILPVVPYDDFSEAIAYVNARPRPLALYYFDRNGRRICDLLSRTTSGGMTVNDCIFHVGQANLPFGGIGPSGMGQYHGFDGFETFSKKKGVFLQGRVTPLALLRPPFGKSARWLLRFLVGA